MPGDLTNGYAMPDRYRNFAKLQNSETEGIDYQIRVIERKSVAAIIAPHGGRIERGTSEVAMAIAGKVFSLYCFDGLRRRPHGDLHIKSTHFDEPKCLHLIAQCEIVVAVHGLHRDSKAVEVGGRDITLRDAICASLNAAGFRSKVVGGGSHGAISKYNVCNRGLRQKGVQLELTRGLRRALVGEKEAMSAFAKCVRQAISARQSS